MLPDGGGGTKPTAIIARYWLPSCIVSAVQCVPKLHRTAKVERMTASSENSKHWQQRYDDALLPLYGAPMGVLAKGDGVYVWDEDGNKYLDLLGGIAVNAIGHAHPDFVKAVTEQVATLGQTSNFLATKPQIQLAEKLLEITGAPDGSRVFFTNSGTEAVEAAIKLSRRLGPNGLAGGAAPAGEPHRTRLLALEGGFHGRSLGSLSLTHKAAYREPFGPLPGDVEFLPISTTDDPIGALESAFSQVAVDNRGPVAALFVEPVQGEAGIRPLPDGYLQRARELTQDAGALLVVDEIQTGIGRTGQWFAYQAEGVVPDVVTIAKGLGGGLPIGAIVTFGSQVTGLLTKGQHGTTFGGNPITTAAALAVLDVIEREGLLENARDRGAEFRAAVAELGNPAISGVRGLGLLNAVELAAPVAAEVVQLGLENGLILNAVTPSAIRLAPALTITAEQLAQAVDFFRRLELPQPTQPPP